MIKSLLTSVALVATVLTANATYQLVPGWNTAGSNFGMELSCEDQWGQYHLTTTEIDPAEYTGYIVKYTNASPNGWQMKISDGTNEQYNDIPDENGALEMNFNEGIGTINTFDIQGKEVGATIKIESVYLKDASDNLHELLIGSTFWGLKVLPYEIPATMIFVGKYGALTLQEDGNDVGFKLGENKIDTYTVTFSNPTTIPLNVKILDVDGGDDYKEIKVGSTSYTFEFSDNNCAKDIAQVQFQASTDDANNTPISFESITKKTKVIDPNTLWEGEVTIKAWEGVQSAPISASKLKVGDILEYTISDPGNEDAQLIVKSEINDWANLRGTAKFNSKDLAKGKVLVGVTQEMLDNCGNTIFLQGDGNVIVSKVYRHEAGFDAKNTLVWGERYGAVGIFSAIPEGAKYVNITMNKVPNYMAICNGSWEEIAQPINRIYTADEAPVTYQVEVTPELLAQINDTYTIIINGNEDSEFVSLSVGNELILDYDVEKLKRVESVEDVPASYATPLDIAYEELPGLGKGSQLVITYTRGTTDLDLAVYAVEEGSEPLQISGYYPPYGTSYVIIPLTEEQVVAISKGILRIEGHDMIINKIYYSEGEEITGISDITVDENAPVEYFNLQGIKISADDATNGIFIRRQGGKSVKVAR